MCGIVGYIGERDSVPIILDSLARLEYRGYDSAGIAVIDASGSLTGSKAEGKLSVLADRLSNGHALHGKVGLGHTRWATHGRPNDANAHPHMDCTGRIAVVHNGIIENYASLRTKLIEAGHVFKSETDTEVLAHLIEMHDEGDLEAALRKTLAEVRGAYALGVISSEDPTSLIFARNGASPLVIGIGEGEMYVASDTPAILPYTRREIILQEGEMAVVGRDGYRLMAYDGTPIKRDVINITWDAASAEKSGYKHFMLKEIFEEPNVIKETLSSRIDDAGASRLERRARQYHRRSAARDLKDRDYRMRHRVPRRLGRYVLAALAGQVAGRDGTRKRVSLRRPGDRSDRARDCDVAIRRDRRHRRGREDRQGGRHVGAGHLQRARLASHASGRRHTLHARWSRDRRRGDQDLCLASDRDDTLRALSRTRTWDRRAAPPRRDCGEHEAPARSVDVVLNTSDYIRDVARKIRKMHSCLFIGRYINYPTALEGALKLKEISYIHAEGYAAGEMKHGPIALLDTETPVIGIMTDGRVREKILSNIMESKAREAPIILVANHGDEEAAAVADHVFWVPKVDELLSPIVNVIPLQLLAYHIADIEGKDVDQPRNLAKTVTVE